MGRTDVAAIGLTLLALGSLACQPPPDAIFLHPYPWEDAAPLLVSDGGASDAPLADAATASPGGPLPGVPYTIVALPDTQYYASDYPDIFDAQARWIAGEAALGNVAVAIHEGDIVDANNDLQWARARRSLQLLEGIVPVVLSAGNHDYQGDGWTTGRGSSIDKYFPVDVNVPGCPPRPPAIIEGVAQAIEIWRQKL